jgi:predicted nucleic acid-binding protein
LYLPEDRTDLVQYRFAAWADAGVELAAPDLWAYEVTAIVHKCVRQGRLAPADGVETLKRMLSLPIRLVRSDALHARALEVAGRLQLPAAYDAHYLAVAQSEGAEFWTLDERLYNAIKRDAPWAHWVGETSERTV